MVLEKSFVFVLKFPSLMRRALLIERGLILSPSRCTLLDNLRRNLTTSSRLQMQYLGTIMFIMFVFTTFSCCLPPALTLLLDPSEVRYELHGFFGMNCLPPALTLLLESSEVRYELRGFFSMNCLPPGLTLLLESSEVRYELRGFFSMNCLPPALTLLLESSEVRYELHGFFGMNCLPPALTLLLESSEVRYELHGFFGMNCSSMGSRLRLLCYFIGS
jgi:hypothetical protein